MERENLLEPHAINKFEKITSLRKQVKLKTHFQATHNICSKAHWKTGVPHIDRHLPTYGLSQRAVHEIQPLKPSHLAGATGFMLGLLAQLNTSGQNIWCQSSDYIREYAHPYWPGLERYGLCHSQLIFARISKGKHLPFALEEALKTKGIVAVIGEGARPDFTGSRRLSFLTQKQGIPCLLLSAGKDNPLGSAAHTRWYVQNIKGPENQEDATGPGHPAWHVNLARARGGRPSPALPSDFETADKSNDSKNKTNPWRIIWNEQTHSFHSFSISGRRTVPENGRTAKSGEPKTMVG